MNETPPWRLTAAEAIADKAIADVEPQDIAVAGVWAVGYADYGWKVDRLFATELDALRYVNGSNWLTAKFIPFDVDLQEAVGP